MKPIIGITADLDPDEGNDRTRGILKLNWNYAQCVHEAGGTPIILPPQADPSTITDLIDGLLIPGGNDIDASHWGEQNHPSVKLVQNERFESEAAILNAAPAGMPVLGICYGCQIINVVRGGSLIQHLPEVLGHNLNSGGTLQEYEIEDSSRLASVVGSPTALGKSYHHQAVKEPGRGIRVVAKGEDGIVEGIEAEDRPWVIGVQWHPERTMEDPATRNLFREFVAAATRYREARTSA